MNHEQLKKLNDLQRKCFRSIQLPVKGSNFDYNRFNSASKKFRELYNRGLNFNEIVKRLERFGGK